MLTFLIDALVFIWAIGAVFSLIGALILTSYGTKTGFFAPLIASALWPLLSLIFMVAEPWENWKLHRRCSRAHREGEQRRSLDRAQSERAAP